MSRRGTMMTLSEATRVVSQPINSSNIAHYRFAARWLAAFASERASHISADERTILEQWLFEQEAGER